MDRKIIFVIFFAFILTMSISSGPASGGPRLTLGGLNPGYDRFHTNLRPLSDLAVQDPLTRLNNQVDARINRARHGSYLGYPGYRFYRRSPGNAFYFKSPGHYFRHGYPWPYYRDKPFRYFYRYGPYRSYYNQRYFGYFLPPAGYYNDWYDGLNDFGCCLGPPWYWR